MQKKLILLCVMLSFALILKEHVYEKESIVLIQKEIDQEVQRVKASFDGTLLSIEAIGFEMVVHVVSKEDIQAKLDENKIVSLSDYQKDNYLIFGHYTKLQGVLFNKLNELKVNDTMSINNQNKTYTYLVEQVGTIQRNEYDSLLDKDSILLLTCTSDYNDDLYYYIKGRLKEEA